MKQLLAFLTGLVLLVPFTHANTDSEYYSYSYARLSYVKGDVFIQKAEDLDMKKVL